MSNLESLKFQIDLSASFWNKKPRYSVYLDQDLIEEGEINEPKIVEFERSIESGSHDLSIRLENKDSSDTVVENGNIIKDMLLNIDDIKIDDIDISHLRWTLSTYDLDQPQEFNGTMIKNLPSCVNLGWNGTYKLHFDSPFYLWLLENL